jgi:hypothetical protein
MRAGAGSATTGQVNAQYANDFRGLAAGAQAVGNDHLSTFREG